MPRMTTVSPRTSAVWNAVLSSANPASGTRNRTMPVGAGPSSGSSVTWKLKCSTLPASSVMVPLPRVATGSSVTVGDV
ncbi:MAG TPA: hypothetical protein VFT96_10755, partial [Gemmatimonadaceae bacterium]|nr:hypothetical protein [Gemmatimonadaceae bacterium]